MRRLCRQNVEASLLDDAEVQPTFAFSVCKNIAFFPDRTKNPIERFYGAIDESTEACRKAYDGVSGLPVKQKIQKHNHNASEKLDLFRDTFQ